MSLAQTSAVRRTQERPHEVGTRPALRPVVAPQRRKRPRLGYAITAVLGAVLIAVAQTGLSAMTTQSTFELAELDAQQRDLKLQSQELYDEVAGLSSPQHLAEQAASLGMVIDATPNYLRLSDGTIVGSGTAAGEQSSVNATDGAAVGNGFLAAQSAREKVAEEHAAAQTEEKAPAEEKAPEVELPPALTDGLPSPVTR